MGRMRDYIKRFSCTGHENCTDNLIIGPTYPGEHTIPPSNSTAHDALLRFTNATSHTVMIYWGLYPNWVQYATLLSGSCCNINSYAGHPWAARHAETGKHVHVGRQFVYIAKPVCIVDAHNRQIRVRREVMIQTPVLSLRENCINSIASHFVHEPEPTMLEITNLCIPSSLKSELITAIINVRLHQGFNSVHL